MMQDPMVFKNPSQFIPERHEMSENANPFSYVPFSAGPRNCIGQKFAMFEMKMILAKVVLSYELLPLGEDVDLIMNLVLQSTNGFQLGLRKRT